MYWRKLGWGDCNAILYVTNSSDSQVQFPHKALVSIMKNIHIMQNFTVIVELWVRPVLHYKNICKIYRVSQIDVYTF